MQKILEYLRKAAPADLAALRSRHPDQRHFLTERTEWGEQTDSATGALPDEERTTTMIELLETGTLHSLADLQKLIPRVMGRLRNCNRAKMAGGFTSAVTGVVAAYLVYSGAPTTATALSTAAFASVGGILTLVAGQFERSPSGARVSLAGDVDKIISLRAEVEGMRRRLARQRAMPIDADEAKRMVDQLDDVAENLVKLSYA